MLDDKFFNKFTINRLRSLLILYIVTLAGRTLRSNVSISADERSSTPTKLIKKLDEGNKSTPNRGTKNISQSDVKLTPVRRSRRISKSEEPEEIDLSAIKSIKHSETIEEEVEEFDQDVNVVKNKPGEYFYFGIIYHFIISVVNLQKKHTISLILKTDKSRTLDCF